MRKIICGKDVEFYMTYGFQDSSISKKRQDVPPKGLAKHYKTRVHIGNMPLVRRPHSSY